MPASKIHPAHRLLRRVLSSGPWQRIRAWQKASAVDTQVIKPRISEEGIRDFDTRPLPKLSIIVVFHDMHREAPRTLRSLCRLYQRGVDRLEYEVLAIDSNSEAPLDRKHLRQAGPEFRYLRCSSAHPTPLDAIRLGVEAARADIIMVCIDGARILTPGILAASMEVMHRFEHAFAYTLSFHLGCKLQPYAIAEGYNQHEEDRLIEESGWPDDGYALFDIGCLAGCSRAGYLGRNLETNCFTLYKRDWKKLGGYDDRFRSPGGGLANLELFTRVCRSDQLRPVLLLGEGTFHQLHSGVGTNRRLNSGVLNGFKGEYARIFGRPFKAENRRPGLFFGETHERARRFLRSEIGT